MTSYRGMGKKLSLCSTPPYHGMGSFQPLYSTPLSRYVAIHIEIWGHFPLIFFFPENFKTQGLKYTRTNNTIIKKKKKNIDKNTKAIKRHENENGLPHISSYFIIDGST